MGRENLCEQLQMLGNHIDGAYAEYVCMPESGMVGIKPGAMTFEEAATIPLAYLTAYYGLDRLAKMKEGERVLIHAAAGGVGQALQALRAPAHRDPARRGRGHSHNRSLWQPR